MKKCKFCQSEIDEKAKVCPICKRTLGGKGCLTAFLIVVGVMIVLGIIGAIVGGGTQSTVATPMSKIAKLLDVTNEQATEISDILAQCGIEEISSVDKVQDLDNFKNYQITYKGTPISFTLDENMKVNSVYFIGNALYESGSVIAQISDYRITQDEKSDLIVYCKTAVEKILKSPSTAKFPWSFDEWKMKKNPNEIVIQCYVDSQNSFGATVRSEFQFILTSDGKTITSFIFDGNELMK
jgi:hypothetical protein